YKAKGFVLIGIPSNDFGGQTPEGNKEVAEFCRLKYGATFPIATKTVVKGEKKSDLVKFLVADGAEIAWNFEKFLIGKNGVVIERFKSGVEPLSDDLTKQIEAAL
ncbi:MAG: glutathione peroxidase, partial [Pseudomonas sp.]|nr:glutathione peroxidase [Pseudomonas sp.]